MKENNMNNELLQQLKQQSGIQDNPDQEGLDLFAKLIVEQCSNLILHRAKTSADYFDDVEANAHARQVQRDCAQTLRLSFGLETFGEESKCV